MIGQLTLGAKADIILVDYKPFTPMTEGNLPWHILFGFHEVLFMYIYKKCLFGKPVCRYIDRSSQYIDFSRF